MFPLARLIFDISGTGDNANVMSIFISQLVICCYCFFIEKSFFQYNEEW